MAGGLREFRMAWLASRSGIRTAIVAIVLAGCQGGVTTSASPVPSPIQSATASQPPATPTFAPTPSPKPDASAVVCPSDLPATLASIAELAEHACYGTTALTIEGWLAEAPIWLDHNESVPSWTIPFAQLYPSRPTVREWTYDFLMAGSRFGLEVVAAPQSGLDLSGIGRWVTLRGHFNDPEVLACTLTLVEEYPDQWAGPDCDRLFLVTSIEPLERPQPACPTASPISLATFLAADASCYIGREVRISAWEDVGEGFGGQAPVFPVSTGPKLLHADAQLVSHRWESDLDQHPIFPRIIKGSGVRFDREDLRVIATGQLGHPVSEGCRPGDIEWTWAPPISWAQNQCRHLFVITDVQIRS